MVARFGKRARLLSKADYSYVFAKPIRSADRFFTVLVRPNKFTHARLGLAVSRKTAKSAVVRNRIKRTIRESFRQQEILQHIDIVVISKPNLVQANNPDLRLSLQNHWQKLNRTLKTKSLINV